MRLTVIFRLHNIECLELASFSLKGDLLYFTVSWFRLKLSFLSAFWFSVTSQPEYIFGKENTGKSAGEKYHLSLLIRSDISLRSFQY